MKRPSTSKLILLGTVAAALVVMIVLSERGVRLNLPQPAKQQPQDPSARFGPAYPARLVYQDNDSVFVYETEADVWIADEAIRSDDRTTLAKMLLDKRVWRVPTGTRVTTMEFGKPGTRRVLFADGRTGWVMSKTITD